MTKNKTYGTVREFTTKHFPELYNTGLIKGYTLREQLILFYSAPDLWGAILACHCQILGEVFGPGDTKKRKRLKKEAEAILEKNRDWRYPTIILGKL